MQNQSYKDAQTLETRNKLETRMIYSLQTRNKQETRMIYLFSIVQNQSAASNEPHDLAWSQWTPWPPQ